jgi:hypothetical protein
MRHFMVFAALVGLSACGGPMTPEEEQTPVGSEVSGQAIDFCHADTPCCSQFTDPTRCEQDDFNTCTWENDRCVPSNG